MKVTLTAVSRKETETKYGLKPRVAIKTDKHEEEWLSTFRVSGTENWKVGDLVDIEVVKKGDFFNFVVGSGNNSDLEERVKKLEEAVFGGQNDDKPDEQTDPF